MRAYTTDILRELGYEVFEATEGGTALGLIASEPRIKLWLFHRYALREIAGLVYVSAFEHGEVIGEELDRDRVEEGSDNGSQFGTAMPKARRSASRATPAASEIITTRPPRAMTSSTLPRKPTTLVDLRIGCKLSERARLWLDILNLFNNTGAHQIDYFYPSQLASETAPIYDVHFKPVEPLSVRFTLSMTF